MIVPYTYRDTLLKLDNICLSFGSKVVLRDMCGDIKDIYIPGRVTGQILAILGPSGMGKTQLFRIMSALNRPTSGQVLVGDGAEFRPVRVGDMGVVAQSYPLFPHRTVFSNLMLPALAHEKDEKTARETVREALEKFGLTECTHLYPANLSGGQRQRVAILQMLICRERFILMDEPFSGLDVIKLEDALKSISQAANMNELNTFVIVTHDVTAAVAIADHIWLLGRERDAAGAPIPGARIVETYDLLAEGLCYEEGIITSDKALTMVKKIKERFRTL